MMYPQKVVTGLFNSMIFSGVVLFLRLTGKSLAQQNSGGSKANVFRAAVVKVDITPDSPKQLLGYGPRLSTGVTTGFTIAL